MKLRLTLLLLLIACACVQAQVRGSRFLKLGVNEGLSQNSVRAIFQDRQGFIWIGTGDGLNRYDGKQIRKYRQNLRDKSGLPGKIVNGKIWQDQRQQLWMIVDGQLTRMDLRTERFYVVRDIGAELECMIIGATDKEIFVGRTQEVLAVDRTTAAARTIPVAGVIGLCTPAGAEPYLLHTTGKALYRYFLQRQASELLYTAADSISNGQLLGPETLGLVAGDQLLEYDLRTQQLHKIYTLSHRENGYCSLLAKAPDGDLIVLTQKKGLLILESAGGRQDYFAYREGNLSGLSTNLVYTAMTDRSNNLWLGTEGGGVNILNLKPRLFEAFPASAIDNGERALLMVKSIYYRDGKIYTGTFDRGLYVTGLSGKEERRMFLPSARFGGIYFIREDKTGRVWINQGDRVGIADLDAGRFTLSTLIPYHRKGKGHNIPQCFADIGRGRYLLGTIQSTYLLRESGNQLQVTDLGMSEPLLETDVQTIVQQSDGDILLGCGEDGGYITLRIDSRDRVQILGRKLDKVTVKCIYLQENGNVWLGTNAGILVQQPGQQEPVLIDEKDGLSNDYVYSILPQDTQTLWISTNKGLNRILLRQGPRIGVARVEQYSLQHGLQSNEFNTGAYYKAGNLLFFGGVTGINWFDQRKFFKRAFAAPVYLTELLVNEQPYQSDTAINFLKHVSFGYRQNNLMFRFAALDFTNAAINQYRYQLQGYDKQWINGNTTGEARYSKLPHGDYSFRVMSANSEGVWSAPQQLLVLHIAPPFWLTWWFVLLAVAVALVLLIATVRYYLKRKLKAQLRIVERQLAVNNERLRISRDMHDELGTGLSKIALLSEVGKTGNSTGQEQRIIREISDTSRSLADKMGEIIWTLNPQQDTLSNLAAYLKEYVSELTDPLPVELCCHFPDTIPELPVAHKYRQELLLVTKEALNNALKYAGATEISFELQLNGPALSFTVSDNGKGFDPEGVIRGRNGKQNGLANMQYRMGNIGGFCHIQSRPGAGTVVRYGVKL